ncbi:MAG TPA: T9SS type A sorting domain-containing protein, partial [Bacteroidia bacterium]|nr:T9SS type A sorting domain-containing protein [Bacteroidia bacterium]
DSAFNVIRKKCFGGTKPDFAYDMQIASDGGFISCGITKSNDGDVTGNHDTTGLFTDAWIVKTDSSGLLQWQFASGGSMTDDSRSVLQTPDGGWLVAGSANSTDGDVTGNHGSYDLRLVKLSAVTGIEENNSVPVSVNIFPNPSGGIVQIGFPVSPGSKWKCEVLNLLGEKVFLKSISSSAQEEVLNLSFLCRGIYVLRLSNGKISVSKLLAIE